MLPFDGRRGMKAKVGVGKSFATMVVFRGLFCMDSLMNGKGSRAATGNTDDADDDGGWKDG